MRGIAFLIFLVTTCTVVIPTFGRPENASVALPVRIGMVRSFFRDAPSSLVDWLPKPFSKLMKDHAGVEGTLEIGGDYSRLASLLDAKKLHLAAFHGFEFAWAKEKVPELEPVVVTVQKHGELRAYVAVLKNSSVASLADLKDKTLAVPMGSKGHCHLFLERSCKSLNAPNPKSFFGSLTRPKSVFAALDELVDEKVDAVLVDSELLQSYKDLKPGSHSWLKVIAKSEAFPSSVLACRKGGLDAATVAKIRAGMTKAHKTVSGRDLMSMFQIAGFAPPPPDFHETLASILQAYPPPEPAVAARAAGN